MAIKTREQLEEYTKDELVKYADDTLGIVLSSAMKKAEIITIIVESSARVDEVAPVARRRGPVDRPDPGKVRVIIHRSHTDKKQRPVFLGHNYKAWLVPRGKEVDLPAEMISALIDAIQTAAVWDDTAEGMNGTKGALVTSEVNSYPYQIVDFGEGTEDVQRYLGYEV